MRPHLAVSLTNQYLPILHLRKEWESNPHESLSPNGFNSI